MRWSKRIFVRALTATVLTGCTSAPLPAESAPQPQTPVEVHAPTPSDGSLKTDRDVYTASCQGEGYDKRCQFTLVMTYTNQTDATVYFDHCYPDSTYPIFFIRGLTKEESAYDAVWACVGHDRSVKVPAGEERVDALKISGPNAWDGRTGEPFGVLEGRLQISYPAYTCADEDTACSLPSEVATSNLFEVRLPQD